MNPKVSIVIPVYNGSNYMREAIDSALNQTYPNIEVIVVNDGSNDNTEDIALSYGDSIRYVYQENEGASSALNKGISLMTGDYFQYLPHDDFLEPNKIELQISKIEESGLDEAIVWSSWDMFIQDKNCFKEVIYSYVHDFHGNVLKGPYPMLFSLITIVTVLFPKSILNEVGEFDSKLSTAQDYDIMFKAFNGRNTLYVDEVLVHYRWHGSQLTQVDEDFMKNCRDMAMKMEDNITEEEINRIFGCEYNFLFRILDHYKLMDWEDCFLRSIKKFKMLKENNNDIENDLIISRLGIKEKNVILYCAGKNSKEIIHYFKQRRIKIKALSDSDINKWGQVVYGIPVISPEEIDKEEDYIVVTKDNPESLVEKLISDGFINVTSFKKIGKEIYNIIPPKKDILISWGCK